MRIKDLVLARSTLQPVRVKVTETTGEHVAGAGPRISLFGGPDADERPATFGLIDGTPAVRPDEPGSYTVCASVVITDEVRRVAHNRRACRDVVYTGAAMEVALTVTRPRGFFTGRVLLEQPDGAAAVPIAGVNVGAVGVGPGANFGGTSGTDGSFKSTFEVQDGPATLRFLHAPDGYYVASIRQGRRDALTEGVLISGEDTNLDVRVARSSNSLRGTIRDSDGKPVDHGAVVLIPQGALALRSDKENTHRTSTTNLNGTFELRNLVPGSYRTYAFDRIEQGAHRDSGIFKRFEERGKLVEIAAQSTASIELPQILTKP